jgi:hypothetical protein
MSSKPQELVSGTPLIERRLETFDRIGCDLITSSLRAGRSIRMRALGQ